MAPFRELYWNIPAHWLIYPAFLPFAALFLYGASRVARLVRIGQPDSAVPPVGRQLRLLLDQTVLQRRLLAERFAGSLHAAISWGFGILFVATCLVAAQEYLGVPTLRGGFYLVFMSLIVDLFGVAATAGVGVALARRYLARPARLWQPRDREGYALFLWLLLGCSKEPASTIIIPVAPPVTDTTPSQYGTPFGNVPDRQDAVIYQVNMRAFSQQGNFQGVIARLDSIKALG